MKTINGLLFFGFYKIMAETGNMGLISWRAGALTCQFLALLLINVLSFIERKSGWIIIASNAPYYACGIAFTLLNCYYIFANENWKYFVIKFDSFSFWFKLTLSMISVFGTAILFILMVYQFSLR